MRSWRFLLVVFALLGGATGLSNAVKAAPLSVPVAAAQSDAAPLVQTAHWYGRRYWHRHRRWHRHHHWRRHHYFRRHFHHHHHRHHRGLRFY